MDVSVPSCIRCSLKGSRITSPQVIDTAKVSRYVQAMFEYPRLILKEDEMKRKYDTNNSDMT